MHVLLSMHFKWENLFQVEIHFVILERFVPAPSGSVAYRTAKQKKKTIKRGQKGNKTADFSDRLLPSADFSTI